MVLMNDHLNYQANSNKTIALSLAYGQNFLPTRGCQAQSPTNNIPVPDLHLNIFLRSWKIISCSIPNLYSFLAMLCDNMDKTTIIVLAGHRMAKYGSYSLPS